MNVLLKRAPSAALSHAVESVWVKAPPQQGDTLMQLPTVRTRIAWEFPSEGCILHVAPANGGQRHVEGPLLCTANTGTQMVTFLSSRPRKFVGVEFKPGGLQAFLRLSVRQLPHSLMPLTDVWDPRTVDEATQRLAQALELSNAAALDVLESVLLEQLQDAQHGERPLQTALHSLGAHDGTVASAATHVGMSDRQFRDVVHAGTGLTPKRYARVARFARALRGVHHQTTATETALAAECGYFDQAHFNHEFKALAGMTPTTYRNEHGEARHPGCPFTALRQRLSRLSTVWRAARPRATEPDAT